MTLIEREKQIKKIMSKLEQLVLKAEEDKKKVEQAYLEPESAVDPMEVYEAKAYEDGAFAAYAIVKKIIEGNYE